jgi:hypothetical protein
MINPSNNSSENRETLSDALSPESQFDAAEVTQATIQQALNSQLEQLDFAVLSALNQRRQIALAEQSSFWSRWLSGGTVKFVLPAAIACGAAVFALSFALRMPLAPISDADAALLAEFDSTPVQLDTSEALDPTQDLADDEIALMTELELNGLDFYAWLDHQPVTQEDVTQHKDI